jgi:cytochrome c-type biogenesis protein CcmH
LLLILVTITGSGDAQETTISDDEVNAIASKLFCPVCENIPLDTCGTAACEDWRYEIRIQLEAGKTEQEIIDDFVVRFGDRVVGTPQDPLLRALSLVTPWVLVAMALLVIAYVFVNWRRNQLQADYDRARIEEETSGHEYRDILEQDIAG